MIRCLDMDGSARGEGTGFGFYRVLLLGDVEGLTSVLWTWGAGLGDRQMSLCSSPCLFCLQEGLGTSLSHLPSGKVPPRNHRFPSGDRPALCDVD